jgi:predicted nucleotidyltransferase
MDLQSVRLTLSYAACFDCPMTAHEIWYWLIREKASYQHVCKTLRLASFVNSISHHFYSLTKKDMSLQRIKQIEYSKQKISLSQKTIRVISMIPSIRLIAITGSVAAFNAKSSSDIDILVVAAKHTVWITRIVLLFVLEILGKRRKQVVKNIQNTFCVNMFMDESQLELPDSEHTLYAAREILQMIPVYSTKDTYMHLLDANSWLAPMWPNAWEEKKKIIPLKSKSNRWVLLFTCVEFIFRIIEPIAYTVQVMYMNKKRTKEVICPSYIRFHPNDMGKVVYKRLRRILRYSNQTLDRIFYAR